MALCPSFSHRGSFSLAAALKWKIGKVDGEGGTNSFDVLSKTLAHANTKTRMHKHRYDSAKTPLHCQTWAHPAAFCLVMQVARLPAVQQTLDAEQASAASTRTNLRNLESNAPSNA